MYKKFQVVAKDDKKTLDRVAELLQNSISEAGKYFKLRIPLVGEAQIGNNWKESK